MVDEPVEGEVDGQEDTSLLEVEGQDESVEGQVSGSDEGADEAEGHEEGDEGQVDGEPARKPSRAQSRIQSLTRTLQEERTKTERIDRELQEFRAEQQRQRTQTAQETPEAKATRRALMDPVEVMREDMRESEARMTGLLHQQALVAQEMNDKVEYGGVLKDLPQLQKYDAEVEKIRLEQVARGVFVPRKVLLELAVGRAAMAAAAKGAPAAKKQAAGRVAAQQSRTAPARGDTATTRGRQGDSPEKRLENVPI